MLQIIIRTVVFYFVIILAIRLMGKRQLGELQPSELVITILLSEIAAMPIQDVKIPIWVGIVASLTLVVLEISISVLTMRSLNFRKMFYGNSSIIIKDGTIDQKMLKKLRVTVPDLLEVLRNQEIFDISQVAYAILETNGQLSVLLKPEYQTVSVNDLKVVEKLFKIINQRLVIVLQFEDIAQLAVHHNKLFASNWQPVEELQLKLQGLNFAQVWQNIILQIGNFQLEQGNTLEKQLVINDERSKLQKQIDTLKKKAWAEKQPKKKFAYAQELKVLERQVEEL